VQPHFLFNTLNSIAALVHDDRRRRTITGQLASLLRSALDNTATPLVTLDEELRIVAAYLDIERVRRRSAALRCSTATPRRPSRHGAADAVENSVIRRPPRREAGIA
jgi:LytS/YehU family sensor histidine kinase